jgi:hypothetical protein
MEVMGKQSLRGHSRLRDEFGSSLGFYTGRSPEQTTIDQFQCHHCLCKQPLKRVEPAWPAIEQATLDEQNVEENENGRRPSHPPKPIDSGQSLRLCTQEKIRFDVRVALL